MERLVLIQILQVLVLTSVSTQIQKVHYVKTSNLPSSSCPDQPCFTLHHYMVHTSKYFTSGSTFVFLSGNHTLESSIFLNDTSNITLKGAGYNSNATLVSTIQYTLVCNNASNLSVQWLKFDLRDNHWPAIDSSERLLIIDPREYEDNFAAALKIHGSWEVGVSDCIFLCNADLTRTKARAIYIEKSHITILRSRFQGNAAGRGGAIYASISTLHISGNVFVDNAAFYFGGALYLNINSSAFLASDNLFTNNTATFGGGAVNCFQCTINITGNGTFDGNRLTESDKDCIGGALHIEYGNLVTSGSVTFSNNEAVKGGAIYFDNSSALFGAKSVLFSYNYASKEGGGIYLSRAHVETLPHTLLKFVGNFAEKLGGGLSIGPNFVSNSIMEILSATFIRNRAECGGAISIDRDYLTLISAEIIENFGSAVCISQGDLTFKGITQILRNSGLAGGSISSKDSNVTFTGTAVIDANISPEGGAISAIQGTVAFNGIVHFTRNIADSEGGAIYALGSNIIIRDKAVFDSNSAVNGGAMYFESSATLILTPQTVMRTYNNSATENGGVIYHQDTPTNAQCKLTVSVSLLPYCFLQIEGIAFKVSTIHSQDDSAQNDGSFLFGGLLDKCRPQNEGILVYSSLLFVLDVFNISAKNTISSKAYELCFCSSTEDCANHTRSRSIEVFRGQSFSVHLLAIGQGKTLVSTQVTAITHNSRLRILQNSQALPAGCSKLTYNLYSTNDQEQLLLYPDGPCRDSGLAKISLHVTFLPCPEGFAQSGEACTCEERLQPYDVDCLIDEYTTIEKKNGSNFWMSILRKQNGSYGGLILQESCPVEYCKTESVNITLDNLDAQCDWNRSGVLCGQCAGNHSLVFGSSRCQICSNHHLSMLIAFAVAGVALVALLTFFKLTVASGMLNSVILYANIIQVNKRLFFPVNSFNILTVFIAWLNLDLGIETCFYHGLTSYVQTWLQFAFPVYVWALISLIIVTARYSVYMSRVIGSDPIAVLATLLLMSYTKILRVIIDVYSSADLDYPEGKTVRVWLKDGNIPYLKSTHLLLAVVTSLVLVSFFLPYTLLLLLGHRLYPFTGGKYFLWFNRIKPLLESYYAPYKLKTRYWTGFLLLVRCGLYLIFSFTDKKIGFLSIIITFTALGILSSGRVYRSTIGNVIEALVSLNLVFLSTATQAELNSPAIVYSLIGVVFAIMIGTIVYQFHYVYIAKTSMWARIKAWVQVLPYLHHSKGQPKTEISLPNRSHDPHKIVSKTVIDLREPLLEP